MTQDERRASAFIRGTLGALESAPADLRDTVLTYINEQCNASRTAKRLYAHRNSVLRRLARAEELLPRPLGENTVQVALALEVVRWRGKAVEAAPRTASAQASSAETSSAVSSSPR